MTKTQIKKEARASYASEDYKNAFDLLYTLGLDEFVSFASKVNRRSKKKNWFTNSKSAEYFWATYVLDSAKMQELFSSKHQVSLFHNYFKVSKVFCKVFELNLASLLPKVYIEAIKKNQLFFELDRIDFICNEIELPEDLKIHQEVWSLFQKNELENFIALEKEIESLLEYNYVEVLHTLVIVLEELIFDIKNTRNVDIESFFEGLGVSYSFFIEVFFSKISESCIEVCSYDFEKRFVTGILDYKKTIGPLVSKTFNSILEYNSYKEKIDNYCFDINLDVNLLCDSLFFYTEPVTHYRWKHDAIRYMNTKAMYSIRADKKIKQQLSNPSILIPGKTEKDRQLNKEMASRKYAIYFALNDLGIKTMKLNDIDIPTGDIIPAFATFASHKKARYADKINAFTSADIKELKKHSNKNIDHSDWTLAFSYYIIQNKKNYQLPFYYSSIEEFIELNLECHENFKEQASKDVVGMFSYSIDSDKLFDRFNKVYNVFANPFIRMNQYIFCPTQYLSVFSEFYIYVNYALQNTKNNATVIENLLKDKLAKSKSFEVLSPNPNKVNGDADLIVCNENEVLLMQLKRTKLRLDSKSRYNELINIDLHAAEQLNKAEAFFNTENEVFEIKGRKVSKWIVTTSMEGISSKIDDCTKVCYFDIMNVLNEQSLTDLSLFITLFEKDKLIMNDFMQGIQSLVFEGMGEIDNYLFPVHYNNLKKYDDYIVLFNKGLNYDKLGDFESAIACFKKCIAIEPNHPKILSAMSNSYANLEDFELSLKYSEEALALVGNDPYISLNHIRTLIGIGNFNAAFEATISLIKLYPFLIDLKKSLINYVNYMLRHKVFNRIVINEDYITEWNELVK